MPNIGFIGLGKLGLPCALAMSVETKSTIYGYDINQNIKDFIGNKDVPYVEKNINKYFDKASILFQDSIFDVVDKSDIVFIAVQTPHQEKFEGISPMDEERSDFNYEYLISAASSIKQSLVKLNKKITVVIICTALPGTIRKSIVPIFNDIKEKVNLLYNPYFIAMGNTIDDFLNPEFILIGKESHSDESILKNFYNSFIGPIPIHVVSIESAELAKVSYNTFIGMKIIFGNMIAEITEKNGGDADEVINVLSSGTKRIISNSYMSPGMGDGGGCHPRDQIAMSWLAKKLDLSSDIFETIAKTRENQTEYHAKILKEYQEKTGLPVKILGVAYKKNIALTIGSPVILLEHYLKQHMVKFETIDPYVYPDKKDNNDAAIYFIGTPHDDFKTISLPLNSTVIDPWGNTIINKDNLNYINLGRSNG